MIGPVARSSAATPVTDFAINRCIYRIIVAPSGKGKSAGSDMILQGTYDLAKMGFRRLGAMACRRPVNEAQTVQRSGVLYAASPLQSAATAARSEEHTSELQSLMRISYAVFCLKTKT